MAATASAVALSVALAPQVPRPRCQACSLTRQLWSELARGAVGRGRGRSRSVPPPRSGRGVGINVRGRLFRPSTSSLRMTYDLHLRRRAAPASCEALAAALAFCASVCCAGVSMMRSMAYCTFNGGDCSQRAVSRAYCAPTSMYPYILYSRPTIFIHTFIIARACVFIALQSGA